MLQIFISSLPVRYGLGRLKSPSGLLAAGPCIALFTDTPMRESEFVQTVYLQYHVDNLLRTMILILLGTYALLAVFEHIKIKYTRTVCNYSSP